MWRIKLKISPGLCVNLLNMKIIQMILLYIGYYLSACYIYNICGCILTNRKFGAGNPWAGQRSDNVCFSGIWYGFVIIDGILGAVLETGSIFNRIFFI